MLKKLLLTLLILFSSLYAYDTRLDNYPNGRALYEKASRGNEDAQFDLGLLYKQKLKNYEEASYWYKKAYKTGSARAAFNLGNMYDDNKDYVNAKIWYKKAIKKEIKEAALNLGLLYKKLHQYDDAIFYYIKAHKMGYLGASNGLGYLYEYDLKNDKKAELWYKKAVAKNHQKAIGNLAKLYHKQNKDELGAAYLIALIDNGYSKSKVLSYLKDKWKLDNITIQKAYKLQQTLDIPKHYTGGID